MTAGAAPVRQRDELDVAMAPAEVFRVVADIEAYPQFVPCIARARIVRRQGQELWVDQMLRLGPLVLPFRTHAVLDPPRRIEITAEGNTLGRFREVWTFGASPAGGTRLVCMTEFEVWSDLVRELARSAFAEMHRETMAAFARRVRMPG